MPLISCDAGDGEGVVLHEGLSLGECHAGLESLICVNSRNQVVAVRRPVAAAASDAAAAAQADADAKVAAAQAAADVASAAQAAATAAAAAVTPPVASV